MCSFQRVSLSFAEMFRAVQLQRFQGARFSVLSPHLLLHSPHFLRICWWTSFVSLCSFHRVFLTFHVFLRIGWCEHLSLRVEAGKGRLYSVTSRHKTQAFHNEWGGERKERNFFIIWHFVQKYIFPLSFGGKNDKVSLAAPAHLLPSSICFPNML